MNEIILKFRNENDGSTTILVSDDSGEKVSFINLENQTIEPINEIMNDGLLEIIEVINKNASEIDFIDNSITEGVKNTLEELNNEEYSNFSKLFNEYEKNNDIQYNIDNRKETHHGIYHDMGVVLDNYTTLDLVKFYLNSNESDLRHYVTQGLIAKEIYKVRK